MNNEKANHYVIDLFETFSIEKNKLLGKEWRDALANYDEEVVKKGWSQVVAECRTRYLPPLKVVYSILNNIRNEQRNEVALDEFVETQTPQDRKDQSRFIKLLQYSMREIKAKRMTEIESLKLHANFFKEIGMDEDADDLLRVVAEKQAA